MNKTTRCSSHKAASLPLRLTAYSATAGAAMLAAPAAQATVHTITSLSLDGVSGTNGVEINFHSAAAENSIGPAPLEFNANVYNHASKGAVIFSKGSSGVNVFATGAGGVLNLADGDTLAGRLFSASAAIAIRRGASDSVGNFLPAAANGTKSGYVEFRVGAGTAASYGWIRVKVTDDANNHPVEIDLLASKNDPTIFGAYDLKGDIAADGFKAGSIAAVPEPSAPALTGLGLLACGAAGVREMRRRRVV